MAYLTNYVIMHIVEYGVLSQILYFINTHCIQYVLHTCCVFQLTGQDRFLFFLTSVLLANALQLVFSPKTVGPNALFKCTRQIFRKSSFHTQIARPSRRFCLFSIAIVGRRKVRFGQVVEPMITGPRTRRKINFQSRGVVQNRC